MPTRCRSPPDSRHAAFADDRVVALRKRLDELVGLRELGGLDDLVARGVEPAVRDVLPDRRMKELCFLQHEADLAAQRSDR